MTIKKTKKQVQVKEITIDERGQAMNDIAILLCNNKQMTYSEIQRHFDFTVSGILLEMELAGLIYQKHYECYVPVEEIIEEIVEEIVEEIKSKTDLHKETDNARQEWLEFEDLANAFLDEYGSHPSEPTLKEGKDWYYQGTEMIENKRKRRSKHDVFIAFLGRMFIFRCYLRNFLMTVYFTLRVRLSGFPMFPRPIAVHLLF